ncbi:MAG: NCS2 family permease [Alphaproteobacteria bacterium]|nr:NCS2 family permease [Alphaproteobacteria bacterium]
MLQRFFRLEEQGTTVRTEVLAGFTTFLTMAYIVLVNPAILADSGMPAAGAAAATCVAAAIGSILMGLLVNSPIALAPGMGLNAYFTYAVVRGMGLPWETALGCVFLSGVALLILTFAGVRRMIVAAIPPSLYAAIAAGIGLFIAFIGLQGAGIVVADKATMVALGDLTAPSAALAAFGLAVTSVLLAWRVRAAILIGILATTALDWAVGQVDFRAVPYSVDALTSTAFRLDIPAALGLGGHGLTLALVEITFIFLFVDLFDNVGTLVGVTRRAGLMAPDGSIPRINRVLATDSVATIVGAVAGTSTVVNYIESASGVAAGGRTGLTAVVVGLLFLVALFVAPYTQAIPAAATAPALVLVGALMMAPLAQSDWTDPMVAIPGFLILIGIPLTFSISNGLALGVIAYAVLKLARGELRRGDWLVFLLAVVFVVRFVWIAGG